MSLFKEQSDVDAILFKFLNFDDLAKLYGINKYYNNKLKPLLKNIIEFHAQMKRAQKYDFFGESLEFGDVEICKYMYAKFNYSPENLRGLLIRNDCHIDLTPKECPLGFFSKENFGLRMNAEIIKWLCSFRYLIFKNKSECVKIISCGFQMCCTNNNVAAAKLLSTLNDFDHTYLSSELIEECMLNDKYQDIIVFLIKICKKHKIKINIIKLFLKSCAKNCYNIALWIFSIANINLNNKNLGTLCLEFCCKNGNLSFVKWLCSKGVDIHFTDEIPFRIACDYGHMNVAKWIAESDYIDFSVHACGYEAFIFACKKGSLKIAKWIYDIDDDIPFEIYEDIYKHCPKHIDKWIKSLDIEDINELNIVPIPKSCTCQHCRHDDDEDDEYDEYVNYCDFDDNIVTPINIDFSDV